MAFIPGGVGPDNPFRQDQPNNAITDPPDNPYHTTKETLTPCSTRLPLASSLSYPVYCLSASLQSISAIIGVPNPSVFQVDRASFPASDVVSPDGGVFVKYNDGRFFFNAELDWVNKITKFHRSLDGTFFGAPDRTDGRGSLFAPGYIEAWRSMVETGVMVGPAKVSFIYAWLPGPDRRNGVVIDRQPYFYGFGNYGLFAPYSLLTCFYYGAGLDLFNLNTDGYMNDASILALRLDYAVASNLNVYGSFFWADRASPAGLRMGIHAARGHRQPCSISQSQYHQRSQRRCSIDSRQQFWDGRLMPVWTGNYWINGPSGLSPAYWQPGKWFNYACIDKTVPNWDIPSRGESLRDQSRQGYRSHPWDEGQINS